MTGGEVVQLHRPAEAAVEHPGPWLLDFDDVTGLLGPFPTKDEALRHGHELAAFLDQSEPGVTRSWNATPLDPNSLTAFLLRLRCRCGAMLLEPSPGCHWHASWAERARAARADLGSVEW